MCLAFIFYDKRIQSEGGDLVNDVIAFDVRTVTCFELSVFSYDKTCIQLMNVQLKSPADPLCTSLHQGKNRGMLNS